MSMPTLVTTLDLRHTNRVRHQALYSDGALSQSRTNRAPGVLLDPKPNVNDRIVKNEQKKQENTSVEDEDKNEGE